MFWFGLFSYEDLIYRKLEMSDGTFEDWPILVVEKDKAIERATKRKERFLSVLPKTYDSLYQKWIFLLQDINLNYIFLDMDEIRMMENDTENFDRKLKEILNSLDDFNSNKFDILMKDFVGIQIKEGILDKEISHPKYKEEIIHLLCGYSWIRKVPWEE
ncbi:hypothetical protein [Acetivibrio straminisolvens]|jgi:hypothetical protein|nr:hypothetical protein [Acetivibrio straminisolvens]